VRIVRVHVENFRGIKLADLYFEGTTVLLGDNNTGKSPVFEAAFPRTSAPAPQPKSRRNAGCSTSR
jgi:recombinational DNA repair ATPase RecF